MLWIIGAIATTIALWYYLVKPLSYWSDMGVPQTKPWVLLGDAWKVVFRRLDICEFVQWLYNLYPNERYVGWYNFRSPVLLFKDPELIKQICVKDFDSFTDHPPFVDPDADPLWSNSLLALTGERWKEMRSVVSPTFTSSKIKSLFELMVETSESFVDYFHGKEGDVIELELMETYTRFTNDVIATTAFGVKVDSLKEKENLFYEMGKKLTDITGIVNSLKFLFTQAFPKLFKYLGGTLLNRVAAKYFYGVINETIRAREEDNIVRRDIIDILLEARKAQANKDTSHKGPDAKKKRIVEISNNDITSQAVLFFFAGFQTVALALCFGTYELAINKDIQDKLREEIKETTKKGKITYDTLQEMRYLDMVLSEILRKWPPFPFLDRLCTKTYSIEPVNKNQKTVTVKKGQEVWIPTYALQRDPKYFPNPDKFDPERFSEENKNNIVPYTYTAFGIGPRNCIGNRFALVEIKALLFHLLLNYEIVPTKKTAIPLVLEKDIQLNAKGGFHLGLKPIKA